MEAQRKTPPKEPLAKPELWTEQEYLFAQLAGRITTLDKPTPENAGVGWNRTRTHPKGTLACEIWPRAALCLEREAYKYWSARTEVMGGLDNQIRRYPHLRALKIQKVQDLLRARASWPDRKKFYESLAAITGDGRLWSLLHPFDDLGGDRRFGQ